MLMFMHLCLSHYWLHRLVRRAYPSVFIYCLLLIIATALWFMLFFSLCFSILKNANNTDAHISTTVSNLREAHVFCKADTVAASIIIKFFFFCNRMTEFGVRKDRRVMTHNNYQASHKAHQWKLRKSPDHHQTTVNCIYFMLRRYLL